MQGILADVNIAGHVERLFQIIEGDNWGEIWKGLNLKCPTFAELNLDQTTSDVELWRFCQEREIVLIIANRRAKSDDSLEATIQEFNTSDSFPVLTLANSERILRDGEYAEAVVER